MPLVATRPPLPYLFSSFSDSEREILERFVRKVGALTESQFSSSKLSIIAIPTPTSGPDGGQGWAIKIDGPDEREVKAVVGDFRQIYTDSNRTSARRIVKMLQRHAHHRDTDASLRMPSELKECGKSLGHRKQRDPRARVLEGVSGGGSRERSPNSIVRDWFNGVYFHDDPGPGAYLERGGDSMVEMHRWSFHSVIKDLIREWEALRRLVVAILRDPALRG